MPFKITCGKCQKEFEVPDSAEGKSVKCVCGERFKAVRLAVSEDPPPVPPVAPPVVDLDVGDAEPIIPEIKNARPSMGPTTPLFGALRVISDLIYYPSILVLCVGTFGSLAIYFDQRDPLFIYIAVLSLVWGLVGMALGESLKILIAVEHNTRRGAELLDRIDRRS